MYKTLIIFLLMSISLTCFSINSNAGKYGFKFLQIPVNPVASALAGTGIYSENYAGAFTHNPAANLLDESFSLSVQHSFWLVDTNISQLIYSNGNRNKHFGLVMKVLDYGKFDIRDDQARLTGNYYPLDVNLMANFGWRILPDHLLGVNAGILYESLDTASSYGINSDFGYIFLPPITNSLIFASVRNIGVTTKMDKEAIKLPLTYETGLGYTYPMENYKVTGQIAINKAIDSDTRINLASEMSMRDILKLRLGYKFNYDEEGITAGLGLNVFKTTIDYGWVSFSDRLNDTHSFGITYHF